jgi:hypothetical protein
MVGRSYLNERLPYMTPSAMSLDVCVSPKTKCIKRYNKYLRLIRLIDIHCIFTNVREVI